MKKDPEVKTQQVFEEDIQSDQDIDKQDQDSSQNEPVETAEAVQAEETTETTLEEPDLTIELKEQKDKYLRLLSDFDNYKRRTSRDKLNIIKQANEKLILKLLSVLDDFERAIDNPAQSKADLEAGLKLIYQKLLTNLESEGLKSMDNSKGQEFDINEHEAIGQMPAPEPELVGKIVEQVEKGYFLNDKVIRYSKVLTGS